MAELWDLTQYVQSHPQDYAQRWRLVKKLYMAWEYHDALDHLLVLKHEWIRKQNVLRYLAATYYRMGKYDDAIRELTEAIEVWPNEICLKEQLARVLESAGRIEEAAQAWELISDGDPKHPVAKRNMQRLKDAPPESYGLITPPSTNEPGANLRPGTLCPNCGAQNGEEFERCWQCHAPLSLIRSGQAPAPTPSTHRVEPWIWTMVGGLATVALLSVGVYFTLQQWVSQSLRVEELPKSMTAFEMLSRNLVLTRTVAGIVLLVTWPLALRAATRFLRIGGVSSATFNVTGLFLASLTYAATWLPPRYLAWIPLLAAAASLTLVAGAFRAGLVRTPLLWLVQGLIVVCAECAALLALEGPHAITEIAVISRFFSDNTILRGAGMHPVHNARLPGAFTVEWSPTGSTWLDHKAGPVAFEIVPSPTSPPMVVDLQEGGKTVFYKDLVEVPFRFARTISPGQSYRLVVSWRDSEVKQAPLDGSVFVYSVLSPRIIVLPDPT